MPETVLLGIAVGCVVLSALLVRHLLARIAGAESACGEMRVLCLAERERCERLVWECSRPRRACAGAADRAIDAMTDAEDAAEFVASEMEEEDED